MLIRRMGRKFSDWMRTSLGLLFLDIWRRGGPSSCPHSGVAGVGLVLCPGPLHILGLQMSVQVSIICREENKTRLQSKYVDKNVEMLEKVKDDVETFSLLQTGGRVELLLLRWLDRLYNSLHAVAPATYITRSLGESSTPGQEIQTVYEFKVSNN